MPHEADYVEDKRYINETLDDLKVEVGALRKEIGDMRVEIKALNVKSGLIGALGGAIGGGIAVQLVTRLLG